MCIMLMSCLDHICDYMLGMTILMQLIGKLVVEVKFTTKF